MECPQCGYVLDPFEKECPKCKRLREQPVAVKEPMPQFSAIAAPQPAVPPPTPQPTPPPVKVLPDTSAAVERRKRIAKGMASAAWVNLVLNTIIGTVCIFGGIAQVTDNNPTGAATIVSGVFVILFGTFLKMVLEWGAELLCTLGRVEDHLRLTSR
jgi:hypothetical protein